MFKKATKLNGDISSWGVSKVTDMKENTSLLEFFSNY